LLLRFLCVACLAFSLCSAFKVEIGAGVLQCYQEDLDPDTPVSFTFQVAAGGQLDIDIFIRAPDDSVIVEGHREQEARYSFTSTMEGLHWFCFSNEFSTITPKLVNFDIIVGDDDSFQMEGLADAARSEDVKLVDDALTQLSNGLREVSRDNHYMKSREETHRNTAESTHSRVVFWAIFEAVMVSGMSVFQVYYMRRFFEVKRAI